MKLSHKIALVTLIGLLTGCGTQKKSSADPSVLVNSERAFAAAAAAQGTRDAFLAYCAENRNRQEFSKNSLDTKTGRLYYMS